MQTDLQPFLDRLTSHSRLNEAEMDSILGLSQRSFNVGANEELVALGESVEQITVVIDGMLARFGVSDEGDRQFTALAVHGDAPDLTTVVLRGDTVPLMTLTQSTIVRVPHSALRAIAARYPAVAEAFWRHCSIDASITASWVINVGRRPTRARICHLLCELAVRLKINNKGRQVRLPFPLTQTQLADAVGVTTIHVNRILGMLRDDGVVHISGRMARIPDWEMLVKEGQFDRSYLKNDFGPGERLRIVG